MPEYNTILRGSDTVNLLVLDDLNKMFTESLLLILENMVAFSKLSCSVFWFRDVDNKDLPPSNKGKLGGPSQRRLATSITSSVLQGVCPSFLEWWKRAAAEQCREWSRKLDSLIILGAWKIWNHCNRCVFDGETPSLSRILQQADEERNLFGS